MSLDLKFDHTKTARDQRENAMSRDIGKNQFALSVVTRIAIAVGILWTVNTVIERTDNGNRKAPNALASSKQPCGPFQGRIQARATQ